MSDKQRMPPPQINVSNSPFCSQIDSTKLEHTKHFHKLLAMSIEQCIICKEAWPPRTKLKNSMCTRCYSDKIWPKNLVMKII